MTNNVKEIDQEMLQKAVEEAQLQTKGEPKGIGHKLTGLLKKELDEYRNREKSRGSEMLGIFAAHNFYANGFTPEELRSTLEDLGPLMSRSDRSCPAARIFCLSVIAKSWRN